MAGIVDPRLAPLAERISLDIDRHSPDKDSIYYNGGTVLVLLCTSAAAFLGAQSLGKWDFVPPLLSASAAFLVGLERALSFGARWRFHAGMRAGYAEVLDQIQFLDALGNTLDDDELQKYEREMKTALHVMRKQEAALPGTGGLQTSGNSGA